MTTNKEWLFSLTLEEYLKWMESEHSEPKDDARGYGADFNIVEPNFGNFKAVEMDASRFEAAEMDASRFVVSEPDSREKLEADAKRYIEHAADYAYEDVLWAGETFTLYDAIIELLDRQAAITERETAKRHELFCETCEAESDKQIAELKQIAESKRVSFADRIRFVNEIDELTAERDNWKEHSRTIEYRCKKAETDCEIYRKKFGKCIDYADAIHALMDEGMA